MAYFNQSFINFFKGLAADNSKEYFDANRKIYQKEVKDPFYQLVADCIAEIGKIEPDVKKLEVKNAVFRINRDIRFSNDKSPYKLHLGGVVSPTGRKDIQTPGLYMHLSIDNSFFGGGSYNPSKENLTKIRQYIIDHPEEVNKALNNKKFQSMFGGLVEGEKNKILPKEFKAYGEKHPLLFNKQFYYMKTVPNGEKLLLRDDLLPFILDHYKSGKVWNDLIAQALA